MSETDAIRRLLDARKDVRLAYVFGSVASGGARPASDVDVGRCSRETRRRRRWIA